MEITEVYLDLRKNTDVKKEIELLIGLKVLHIEQAPMLHFFVKRWNQCKELAFAISNKTEVDFFTFKTIIT